MLVLATPVLYTMEHASHVGIFHDSRAAYEHHGPQAHAGSSRMRTISSSLVWSSP